MHHYSKFVVSLYKDINLVMNKMSAENKYISTSSVKQSGRSSYYKMLKKAKSGELIQVRRGVYATEEQLSGNMIDINTIIEGGVLCLWSAWNIYGLTTSMPQAFHVAVSRSKKVIAPVFPPIEIHYCSDKLFNIGVTHVNIDGYNVMIYDIEKCVCDAVKFRNKIGIDVCAEIITEYLSRRERNISKLMDYARKLRVASTLEKYLEVKL